MSGKILYFPTSPNYRPKAIQRGGQLKRQEIYDTGRAIALPQQPKPSSDFKESLLYYSLIMLPLVAAMPLLYSYLIKLH